MDLRSSTTSTLLARLAEPGHHEAWSEVVSRYRPIIYGFCRGLRLSHEDADDVTQQTFINLYQKFTVNYDPQKGRLKPWLLGIARREVANVRRRRWRERGIQSASKLDSLSSPEIEKLFDQEKLRVLKEVALDHLRVRTQRDPKTIRAFELVVFEEQSPDAVAKVLGTSLDAVYAAKHRCIDQLKKLLKELSELYELD